MSLKLAVSKVTRNYDGKDILKDCSFSFESQGMYILIGPNGSGKSTFLRVCALLEEPDNGEVIYRAADAVVTKDLHLRRRISLVLPKIGVFNTTVFNNIRYGLKIRGWAKKDIEDKVSAILDFVGLTQKKDLNALSLSSGEIQRLGIARAIIMEPEILFLDEPTASLDPYNTTVIEEMITKLKKRNRMTIIMVTHNMFQAQRLADTVLFMYDGRIEDCGRNREFFENPGDERAQRFITGQMVY
jgi:ABC-type phosphate transport system ATPase subunit